MFTGLVQAVGSVESLLPLKESPVQGQTPMRLAVRPGSWGYVADVGDSVAVNGVCLTAVRPMTGAGDLLVFDVVPQTLSVTTLGALRPGAMVNLEHAATASTLMGGHVVQGHVDGVASVRKVQQGGDWRMWVDLDESLRAFVVDKGSITIDGVSLTVAGVDDRGLVVALIPTTLEKTTLKGLRPGDRVNIEVDLIAKSVVNWLKGAAASGSLNTLLNASLRPGVSSGHLA